MVSKNTYNQRPSSHGNAIVPFDFRSNFWNEQIGCSHGNGTIAYQYCFVFRREHNRSVDLFSICLFTRERNDCALFHFSYHLFSRSIFWNGTVLFEAFPSERNPSAVHFWNNTERNGTIAFPCERSLNDM